MAVSYGQYDFAKQKGGLVCCWSIKNPEVCNISNPADVFLSPAI